MKIIIHTILATYLLISVASGNDVVIPDIRNLLPGYIQNDSYALEGCKHWVFDIPEAEKERVVVTFRNSLNNDWVEQGKRRDMDYLKKHHELTWSTKYHNKTSEEVSLEFSIIYNRRLQRHIYTITYLDWRDPPSWFDKGTIFQKPIIITPCDTPIKLAAENSTLGFKVLTRRSRQSD